MREPETLSIGQVAKLAGVSTQAIRYYERIGLLPRPAREANGYRCYTQLDVKRIVLLHQLRSLGTPLSAAKPLVAHAVQARCADVQQDLLALATERIAEIDCEIAALQSLRADVESYRHQLARLCIGEQERFATCRDVSCITEPHACDTKEIPMIRYETEPCDCPICSDCPDCGCDCAGCGCCLTA